MKKRTQRQRKKDKKEDEKEKQINSSSSTATPQQHSPKKEVSIKEMEDIIAFNDEYFEKIINNFKAEGKLETWLK